MMVDGKVITRAAWLCMLSYKNINAINMLLADADCEGTAVAVGTNNAFAFILRNGKYVDIVIRGTNDPIDIIRDMDIFQTHHSIYLHVHDGVLAEWSGLRAKVFSIIRPGDVASVYGHSLGGGIANLCQIDLLNYDKIKVQPAITFGQLMIFGKDAAEKYADLPLIRVRNAKDRVPSLPSPIARMIFSWGWWKIHKKRIKIPAYFFAGQERWLTPGGRPKPARPGQIKGHAIKEYWNNCKTQLVSTAN